jgi:hypothetical protein
VAARIVLLVLPFVYFGVSTEKFSEPWFLIVPGPAPFSIAIRHKRHHATFPIVIAPFFMDQYPGGLLRRDADKSFISSPTTAVW